MYGTYTERPFETNVQASTCKNQYDYNPNTADRKDIAVTTLSNYYTGHTCTNKVFTTRIHVWLVNRWDEITVTMLSDYCISHTCTNQVFPAIVHVHVIYTERTHWPFSLLHIAHMYSDYNPYVYETYTEGLTCHSLWLCYYMGHICTTQVSTTIIHVCMKPTQKALLSQTITWAYMYKSDVYNYDT